MLLALKLDQLNGQLQETEMVRCKGSEFTQGTSMFPCAWAILLAPEMSQHRTLNVYKQCKLLTYDI